MESPQHFDNILNNSFSILLEDNGFSYLENNVLNNQIVKKNRITEGINILLYPNKLADKLSAENLLQNNYGFVDISLLTKKFTLIPMDYFDEELAEIYLNYNVPFSKEDSLRFNLIPHLGIVIVFYYLEGIEAVFTGLTSKISITHAGFKFLSKIYIQPKKNQIFINIHQSQFELAVIRDENLLLYNIFPFLTEEDILYYIQVAAKNLQIAIFSSDLYYYGLFEEKKLSVEKLLPYFQNILPGDENELKRENITLLDII